MDEIERGHNQSMESLNVLYQQAVADHNACSADDRSQEIYELKGRLEAQSDLVSSHRSLIEKHQISTSRLEEVKTQLERKEAELFVVQKRIDLHIREKDELEKDLRDLKADVQSELQGKSDTIDSLESSIKAYQTTEQILKEHLAARHAILCRQFFGRGPYYVKFTVDLPKEGEMSFVVELTTRKEMPLSTFSLLTLVESNFYGGLRLSDGGHHVLRVGAAKGMDDNLHQKLKSLGFLGGSTPFFDEWSPHHSCQAGSLSFDDWGPGLLVHTIDPNETDGSCFGSIVRGKDDILPLIRASLQEGKSVAVLSADVLLVDDTSAL